MYFYNADMYIFNYNIFLCNSRRSICSILIICYNLKDYLNNCLIHTCITYTIRITYFLFYKNVNRKKKSIKNDLIILQ